MRVRRAVPGPSARPAPPCRARAAHGRWQVCPSTLHPGRQSPSAHHVMEGLELTLSTSVLRSIWSLDGLERGQRVGVCRFSCRLFKTSSPIPWFFSLRDTLVSYMETKDGDVLPEVEAQFPEEIQLSNCVSVWKMAVELKRGRQMR